MPKRDETRWTRLFSVKQVLPPPAAKPRTAKATRYGGCPRRLRTGDRPGEA